MVKNARPSTRRDIEVLLGIRNVGCHLHETSQAVKEGEVLTREYSGRETEYLGTNPSVSWSWEIKGKDENSVQEKRGAICGHIDGLRVQYKWRDYLGESAAVEEISWVMGE